jgi:hypothetical protein
MRFFYNIIILGLIFNISAWLISIFALTPYVQPARYDPANLLSIFNLDIFRLQFSGETLTAMVGGAALLLASLVTRQNTYALYALVVWAVGVLIQPINDFIYAIPNAINDLIGKTALNPWYGSSNALLAATNPYSLVFTVIFTVGAWFFLMEVILQRPLT